MAKKPRGRPKKLLTAEQMKLVCKCAGVGLSQAQIADLLEFTDRTLRQRLFEDPAFSSAYHRARADWLAGASTSLAALTRSEDPRIALDALKFTLNTQGGWTKREARELTGADGGAIELTEVVVEHGGE